jgi:hypothetical protein
MLVLFHITQNVSLIDNPPVFGSPGVRILLSNHESSRQSTLEVYTMLLRLAI